MIPGHQHLCIEEGTQSAWLYEILRPHVQELVVPCFQDLLRRIGFPEEGAAPALEPALHP